MLKRSGLIGLAPLLIYMAIFLGLPLTAVFRFSFLNSENEFTLNNFATISNGIYREGFILSSQLSLVSALISLVFGFLFAYALATTKWSI